MGTFTIKKKNLQAIGIWFVTIGIFYFPRSIRLGLTGSSVGALNVLPFLGTLIIISRNKGINIRNYYILFILYILMYLTEARAGLAKPAMMLTILVNFIFPLILISINRYETNEKWINKYIRLMNISVLFTLVCGIIDTLTPRLIGKMIANFSKDSFFITLSNSISRRLFTWYGHYIYTGELFFIFYLVNVLYYREVLKRKEPIGYFPIALLGILLVGSKTCTVLILIVYILLNGKSTKHMFVGIILILGFYFGGVFDLLLERLLGGNLTTGRSESLLYLFGMKANIFPILLGNGTNYISYITKYYSMASAGLEYVVFMFTAYFGVVFTVILYSFCFIKPIVSMIKRKKYNILICFIALTLDVNSYNGLAIFQDQMWAFCWAAGIILMIMQVSTESNNRKCKPN